MSGSPPALSLLVRHFLLLVMTSSLLYAEAAEEKPCGTTEHSAHRITSRIVNGKATNISDNPWMVQVQVEKPKGTFYRCGGSIIHSEYILTAAHCLFHKLKRVPESSVRVVTGETWWHPEKSDPVEKVFVHENYKRSRIFERRKNDIALIKLKDPLNLDYFHYETSICLPKKDVGKLSSLTCKAAGWGNLETRKGDSLSQRLMEVNLDIADPETCQQFLKPKWWQVLSDKTLHEVTLCASAPNKDICAGDSGGPLACQNKEDDPWFLAGITSFGPERCAKKGKYSGFVDVSKYLDWIDKITEGKISKA